MTIPDYTAASYPKMARIFHWITALLILTLLTMGWMFEDLPKGDFKRMFIDTHKALGLAVLFITLARLAWWKGKQAPAAVEGPVWQQLMAKAAHKVLYVMLFALPLSGYLFVTYGRGLTLFGVKFPQIGAANPEFSHLMREVHGAGASLLAIVLGLHAGAALWHHFVRKDPTLERMLKD